jgi:hypothetical protein
MEAKPHKTKDEKNNRHLIHSEDGDFLGVYEYGRFYPDENLNQNGLTELEMTEILKIFKALKKKKKENK